MARNRTWGDLVGGAGMSLYLPPPGQVGRKELIQLCKSLATLFERELGIAERVRPIKVILVPTKRNLASIQLGRIPSVWLRVTRRFLKWFEIDYWKAYSVLRYVIAHEVAHLWQRLQYGVTYFIAVPSLLIESEADEIAEKLVGYSAREMEKDAISLIEKTTRTIPIKPTLLGDVSLQRESGGPSSHE